MVRQVHHGGPVRLGAVGDEQLVLGVPRVRHGDIQMAGVAFLAIDAAVAELGDGGGPSVWRGPRHLTAGCFPRPRRTLAITVSLR